MPSDPLAAAGGVPWRRDGGQLRLAVVHRPRYDDWSFPKGKLRHGEEPLPAAVREVREETGLAVVVGRRLPRRSYLTAEGLKVVDYWSMLATGEFVGNDETDGMVWLSPEEAVGRLSYADDQALAADLLAVPVEPVRLLVVRHGRAGDSEQWSGPDVERPLDERGRAEAQGLAEVLPWFGPDRILTADPVRCRQTVQPLAERLGLEIGRASALSEDEYFADPLVARKTLRALLGEDEVTVVCSQGGVIPDLLQWLLVSKPPVTGVSPRRTQDWPPARKGSAWALTARDGVVVSADYYPSFM